MLGLVGIDAQQTAFGSIIFRIIYWGMWYNHHSGSYSMESRSDDYQAIFYIGSLDCKLQNSVYIGHR